MLLPRYQHWPEVGVDEAGRGCLAGPVFAAAVLFPEDYHNKWLNDSKKLSGKQRANLRKIIEQDAISSAIGIADHLEIDAINILQATYLAMHRALDQVHYDFEHIIIDGNRFKPYKNRHHCCLIKGDGKYLSIAAASILAKSARDEYMEMLHAEFPEYNWKTNKGYPTENHRNAIRSYGASPYHRKSFTLLPAVQPTLFDPAG